MYLFGHLLNIIRAASACFIEDFGAEACRQKKTPYETNFLWHTFNLNFNVLLPT